MYDIPHLRAWRSVEGRATLEMTRFTSACTSLETVALMSLWKCLMWLALAPHSWMVTSSCPPLLVWLSTRRVSPLPALFWVKFSL